MIALSAMQALDSIYIRVPEDISIIGFDDSNPCVLSTRPLTTIYVPKLTMRRAAVRLIQHLLEMPTAQEICKIQLNTSIVERRTALKKCLMYFRSHF